MTNEEAKDYIREWCPYDRQEEIIKALEQEPCEDCISRKGVQKWFFFSNCGREIQNCKNPEQCIDMQSIMSMPSVQPAKEIYNKGWQDGAEATAYHVELCEKENPTIPMSVIEDIKAEIKANRDEWIKGQDAEWHTYDRCLFIIDKYKAEKE